MTADRTTRDQLAAALREKATEAAATACDMDCDPADCPSCSQPIQAFSLIGGVPDAIFGTADDIADALLPVVDRLAAERAAAEDRSVYGVDVLRHLRARADALDPTITEETPNAH